MDLGLVRKILLICYLLLLMLPLIKGDIIVEGEAWKVGTSTKILEISENLESAAGTNRESIANITSSSFIDDAEMPSLLRSGIASNNKGDAPYDQRLYFEDWTSGYVQLLEDDSDVTADFLYFPNGKQIARYELEFTTALESDIDDTTGAHTKTGDYLTDFEDVELTILGKKYTVLQARRNGGNQNQVNLILILYSVKDTLLEGNTKTYSVDDRDYEVTLDFVDSDSAKFTVNGQATKDMIEGGTDKLSDGKLIGVLDVLYQDYAGGVHQTEFFIGTQKIELRDTDITDKINSNELKIDDETIDGAAVIIKGSDNNVTFKLDEIILNMTADDDYFVPAGGRLSENPELDEPDLLFTRGWDIEYRGLSPEIIKEINIKHSGLDDYYLGFFDGSGNKANLPLIHSPNGSTIKFGDNDDDLIVTENKTIKKNDYFILTDESDENGKRRSFALRYKGADKITAAAPVIKFEDLGSGQTIERLLSYFSPTGEIAQIKLGGGTFRVYNASSIFSNDFDILVDMDASGSIGNNIVTLNSQYGAEIKILNDSTDQVDIIVRTPNRDDYDDLIPTPFLFNLYATGGEVRLKQDPSNNHNFQIPDNDDENLYAYSSYGAFARIHTPLNYPQEVFIQYPQNQRVPQVYITGGGTNTIITQPADCTFPSDGIDIIESTTFCPGTYNLPNGIEIGANNLVLDCKGTILKGIGLDDNYVINVINKNNVTIKNCVISNSDKGGIKLIRTNNSNLLNNEIYNVTDIGIVLFNSNKNLISNNNLNSNLQFGGGIFIYGDYELKDSNYNAIVGNNISNNEKGINLAYCSNNTVSNNNIFLNTRGISFEEAPNNLIIENSIYENSEYNIWNRQSYDVIAELNYWGTTDIYEIQDKIYDYNDENTTGIIDFCPYLDNPYPFGSIISCEEKTSKLVISDLDVKVDGKSDKNIQDKEDGYKISDEAKPGSTVEFELKIENLFTDEENVEINDIEVIITIEDIDNDDDLEEESKEFDLNPEDDEKVTLEFDIPLKVDDGSYDVIVEVEGKDEIGTTHRIEKKLGLEVEKENHELRITRANLNPSELSCNTNTKLDVEILNLGEDEEDEVKLEIINYELGLNIESNIELEIGTDDEASYSKSFTININENLLGIYPVLINAYYDNDRLSDTKTIDLLVKDCLQSRDIIEKAKVKDEKEAVEVIGAITTQTIQTTQQTVSTLKAPFTDTLEYISILIGAIVLITGIILFGVGYLLIKK